MATYVTWFATILSSKPLKYITRDNHSIVYADLLSKGIKTVSDLYNPIGLLESWKLICQKFRLGNSNFISWYSAVRCIPREWKEFIRHTGNLTRDNFSDFRQGVFISGFFTKLSQVKTNQIYDSLVRKSFNPPPPPPQRLRRHFQRSLKLVKNCGPKFTCYQVNVQLILEPECSNT